MTNNYTVYTGTFKTQKGETRTMNFIRPSETPRGTFPELGRERNLQPGYETVWDVDRSEYRTFNNNTRQGEIRSEVRNLTIELF